MAQRKVYIAEKPSVGRFIAKILAERSPVVDRSQTHVSGSDWSVCWGRGHIFENCDPDYYIAAKFPNAAKGTNGRFRWNLEHHPIDPGRNGWPDWNIRLQSDKKEFYTTIKRLVSDAHTIVHAGDVDREGQRLVDEILEQLKWRGPVGRILVTANQEQAVRKALADERPNKDFAGMSQAALARSHADWYCGMNLSPVLTLTAQKNGFRGVLPYGRVQTPVFGLVVKRDLEIENFKPVDFFTLTAQFQVEGGSFKATWKPHKGQAGLDAEGRLLDRSVASTLQRAVVGQTGKIAQYEDKQKSEGPPPAFSIDKLQILGINKYGMSADGVLKAVQALYDAGLVTYPRSDSAYLPTEMHAAAPGVLATVKKALQLEPELSGRLDPSRRSATWDDAKVTAHHGIVPTGEAVDLAALPRDQANMYREIATRYAAQFMPNRAYRAVSVLAEVAGQNFAATGTTTTDPGWRALYGAADGTRNADEDAPEGDENAVLPPIRIGEPAACRGLDVASKKTKPPARYTEASLLKDMVEVHKLVEDEKVKSIFKKMFEMKKDGDEGACGLGTGATRHTYVPKLIESGMLAEERVGRKKCIVSTPTARAYYSGLDSELAKPDMTALWEAALGEIEAGRNTYERFMQSLTTWVKAKMDVAQAKGLNIPSVSQAPPAKKARGAAKGKGRAASSPAKTFTAPDARACSKCNKPMVLRQSAKGAFYGCSGYPECRHTEQAADAA
ncbi:MAG: hypothetical protein EPN79_16035 [Burkholderiaceae bacterium]|nr:MAG: hypothetical protein EPN79_16035 [Burkholderiaceae bacterium]